MANWMDSWTNADNHNLQWFTILHHKKRRQLFKTLTLMRPWLSSSLAFNRASTTLLTSRWILRPKSRNMVDPPDSTMFWKMQVLVLVIFGALLTSELMAVHVQNQIKNICRYYTFKYSQIWKSVQPQADKMFPVYRCIDIHTRTIVLSHWTLAHPTENNYISTGMNKVYCYHHMTLDSQFHPTKLAQMLASWKHCRCYTSTIQYTQNTIRSSQMLKNIKQYFKNLSFVWMLSCEAGSLAGSTTRIQYTCLF